MPGRSAAFSTVFPFTRRGFEPINVPVYVNETGQYNQVFIDTNKIATVFGRPAIEEYIKQEIKKGNLVRIKNRSIQAGERTAVIAAGYGMNASKENVSQTSEGVKSSERDSEYLDAVESNDMSTAQKLVDEAAKEAGYTIKAYHGTNSYGFTKFQARMGQAFNWFSTNKDYAEHYKKRALDTPMLSFGFRCKILLPQRCSGS